MSNEHMNTNTSNRIYGGKSSHERIADRKQQFLEAGLILFGTVGYRAVTVRILCKQAKLTDRYFYESFTDTEDLLIAVYQNCLIKFQQTILSAINSLTADSNLQTLVEVCLDYSFTLIENPHITRVCWLEVLGVSPKVDQIYTHNVRQLALMLLEIIRSRHPLWKIDHTEAEILSIALIGAVGQTAIGWMLSNYTTNRDTILKAMLTIFQGLIQLVETPTAIDNKSKSD